MKAERMRRKTRRLLEEYVELCNQVITDNRERFWFRQAERMSRIMGDQRTFRTVVYGDDPEEVVGEFILHYDPISMQLTLLPDGDEDPGLSWKVSVSYLQDVVDERPEWYRDNPLMLDGIWLADRIRDEVGINGRVILITAAGFLLGALVGVLSMREYRRR